MWIAPTTGGGAGKWLRRAALLVDVGGGPTIDVDAALSDLPDWFWENVLASGDDLRVTEADGVKAVPFEADSFNATTRTGTIQIDNYTPDADALNKHAVFWLYWSHTGTPATASTPVTVSGARASYFQPYTRPTLYRYTWRPERLGVTNPRKRITKQVGETIHVWWNLEAALSRMSAPQNGALRGEEIRWIAFDVTDGGASQAGMFDATALRVLHPGLVRTQIQAGTNATAYTLELTIGTSYGRVLEPRILLKVQNVDEQ